ncbi:MAG: hypothetical protein ACHQEM_12430 [Chitinophagales bacterium]
MNRSIRKNAGTISIRLLIAAFSIAMLGQQVVAQNTSAPARMNEWKFLVEPYFWMASMNGSIGVGNLPSASICIPFNEILSHLSAGLMLYAEGHNDKFAISSDLFYASLKQDASGKNGIANGNVTVKQLMWELAGLYRVSPWLEFGLGARINSLDNGVDINVDSTLISGPHHRSGSKSVTWVDPIVITRLMGMIDKKWMLQLRADIGGFGIGSQLTWQLHPIVAYRFSKLFQTGIGYRILSIDYNKGSGSDQFIYDMDIYGPEIRLGFNF